VVQASSVWARSACMGQSLSIVPTADPNRHSASSQHISQGIRQSKRPAADKSAGACAIMQAGLRGALASPRRCSHQPLPAAAHAK